MNGQPTNPDDTREEVVDVPDFRQQTTNLESKVHDREAFRGRLAYLILGLISLLGLGIAGATIAHAIDIEDAKDLVLALLAPLFSIFAAIVGFYYGHEAK